MNTIQQTKRLLPYNHRVMLAASVYLEYIQVTALSKHTVAMNFLFNLDPFQNTD